MKKLFFENGVTGIDLVISILVIVIFTSVVSNLMLLNYKNLIEIKKSSEMDAYATIIMEKVDEKAYEEIDDDFVTKLISNDEIKISEDYNVNFETSEYDSKLIKKVTTTIIYETNENERKAVFTKLKIKEIGEDK